MSEIDNEQNEIISRHLKNLIRGLTQDDVSETYESYKTLFRIGKSAIPQIRDVLLQFDCSKIKFSNEFRYISGLFSLIYDINETEADKLAAKLKDGDCNFALAKIIDSICKFTVSDYIQYSVCGVKVLEHTKIFSKQNVRAKLKKWLENIPANDLKEIERIYILKQEDLEVRGSYTPILFRINLVWDNPSSRWSPISFVNNFVTEYILYHEIGHHVYRHKFGQVPKQEKQAGNYADKIMGNSNHLLFQFARLLKSPKDR